jgi:hypothetical protein
MPKPNYKYEKRQKEIAKQKKKEEKLKRKQEKKPEEVQTVGKAEETSEQSTPVIVAKEETDK